MSAAPAASRLRVELFALFGLGPALAALGPRWGVSLGILASGLLAAVALLLDRSFPRGALWGPASRPPWRIAAASPSSRS